MGLKIDGEVIASDQNFSKKKAEQKAAEKACELLRIAVD
jgi:dsRNA-specific ribonuclease